MCSFTAAVLGTYYGAEMAAAERQGRICGVPYDSSIRVTTAWDLRIGDSTAIWFMQKAGKEIHLIDYYEASGQALSHYVQVLEKRGYFYDRHILPHDAQARELGTGTTRIAVLERLGLRSGVHDRIEIAPRQQDEEGINAVRSILSRCWFDAVKCRKGIEALKLYRTEWDQDKRVFRRKPLHDWTSHDWTSHAADAFAYMAMMADTGGSSNFHRKIEYPNLGIV
jgi:hypothetical protein